MTPAHLASAQTTAMLPHAITLDDVWAGLPPGCEEPL